MRKVNKYRVCKMNQHVQEFDPEPGTNDLQVDTVPMEGPERDVYTIIKELPNGTFLFKYVGTRGSKG